MNRTLLLNATYEPLAVVPVKRAIVLVLAEKADILESGESEYHSANAAFNCPKVIRLRYYVRVPYHTRRRLSKNGLLARDNYKCGYCGHKATTIDHIIPTSRGGKHEWENVVACCSACNTKKADKLLSELGWTLKVTPYTPKGIRWVIVGVAKVDPSWEPYISSVEAVLA